MVLIFATAVRAGGLAFTSECLRADPDGYAAVAGNLLECGTLGHGQEPTAFRPPLYPLLLAGARALAPCDLLAVAAAHVAMGAATAGLVYWLARRSGLGRAALLAAVLVVVDPILLRQSTLRMTETPAALLGAAALVALTQLTERPTAARGAVAGALLALAALCRAELMLWLVAACLALPWLVGTGRRQTGPILALVAAAVLVLAPWAARNWILLGRPVVTTTHGGYTLLLANNRYFYRHLEEGRWCEPWDAADFHAAWARRRKQLIPASELAADRQAYRDAFEEATAQPGWFALACAVRAGRFWQLVPHPRSPDERGRHKAVRWLVGLWYAGTLALAVVGLWRVLARGEGTTRLRRAMTWAAVMTGVLFAVHLVYWTDMRMRAPAAAALALAAAAGVGAGRREGRNLKSGLALSTGLGP